MMNRLYATIGFAGLLAACGSGGTSSKNPAQVAAVGRLAPSWQEPTSSGGTLALSSLRGKAVYLNFFASWCPPCNAEASDVEALQRKYASRNFAVVGVDVLENQSKTQSFVQAHHLSYPAVVDSGTLRDQYNVNGLPVHVFIDRTGIVRAIAIGELTRPQMESHIRSIL